MMERISEHVKDAKGILVVTVREVGRDGERSMRVGLLCGEDEPTSAAEDAYLANIVSALGAGFAMSRNKKLEEQVPSIMKTALKLATQGMEKAEKAEAKA